MHIRSITGLLSLSDPVSSTALRPLGDLVRAARAELGAAGFPVQTARVATQSLSEQSPRDLVGFARSLQEACQASGIEYAALGAPHADRPQAPLGLIQAIPAALAAAENVFASVQVASHEHGINFRSIQAAAGVIRTLAESIPDGMGNFRFAVLANCPPHSAFFPVAYHEGTEPTFALAAEGAVLAVQAFSGAKNLEEARANLIDAVERVGEAIGRLAADLASRYGFHFAGIDFSLAPFPETARSIGTAVEALTGAAFGQHGTLFAAAFLTDCLRHARFPRTGFSGLLLPVLEDSTLAARSADYTLDSLLLYSAVCGTGLDTIPLPGNTSEDALAAILLDVATLALALDKPLTARLIPLPGLRPGDDTRFHFEYFANARVLDAHATRLKVFDANSQLQFASRQVQGV